LLQARGEKPEIRLVLPEEGTMLWVDAMCVPATSKHADLAHAFIDFLHEPEVAARNAAFVRYATPNRESSFRRPARDPRSICPGPRRPVPMAPGQRT
jgi:spermidine/putrescine transport system substrate-binding protein